MTLYVKNGDLLPVVRVRLKDAEDNYIDLTDATVSSVTFSMAPKLNAVNTKVSAQSCNIGFTAEDGTVYDGSLGHVEYLWQSGDTDTDGEYLGEFRITFTNTKTLSCPSNGYYPVIVRDRIG